MPPPPLQQSGGTAGHGRWVRGPDASQTEQAVRRVKRLVIGATILFRLTRPSLCLCVVPPIHSLVSYDSLLLLGGTLGRLLCGPLAVRAVAQHLHMHRYLPSATLFQPACVPFHTQANVRRSAACLQLTYDGSPEHRGAGHRSTCLRQHVRRCLTGGFRGACCVSHGRWLPPAPKDKSGAPACGSPPS